MRASFLRVLTVAVPSLTFIASQSGIASAQPPAARQVAFAVEPVIATKLEALLALPNAVLVIDYYYIDMRFGPNLRVDAVIVEAVDSQTRLKGLRVQVRDKDSRGRQEGTSYMDIDELRKLSRGLQAMASLAARWAPDDRRANELSFTSAGGFRLAIRQSARVPRAYLSTGLLDPVVTSIEIVELGTLKDAFDQALTLLDSK